MRRLLLALLLLLPVRQSLANETGAETGEVTDSAQKAVDLTEASKVFKYTHDRLNRELKSNGLQWFSRYMDKKLGDVSVLKQASLKKGEAPSGDVTFELDNHTIRVENNDRAQVFEVQKGNRTHLFTRTAENILTATSTKGEKHHSTEVLVYGKSFGRLFGKIGVFGRLFGKIGAFSVIKDASGERYGIRLKTRNGFRIAIPKKLGKWWQKQIRHLERRNADRK